MQSLYGSTYTEDNVLISGSHTHSGPAGYFQYTLYEVGKAYSIYNNITTMHNIIGVKNLTMIVHKHRCAIDDVFGKCVAHWLHEYTIIMQ